MELTTSQKNFISYTLTCILTIHRTFNFACATQGYCASFKIPKKIDLQIISIVVCSKTDSSEALLPARNLKKKRSTEFGGGQHPQQDMCFYARSTLARSLRMLSSNSKSCKSNPITCAIIQSSGKKSPSLSQVSCLPFKTPHLPLHQKILY